MKTSRNTRNQTEKPKKLKNRNIIPRFVQEKLAITVLVIMLALFLLGVRLYSIIDSKNDEYTKIVLSQRSTYDSRTIPYRRGDIVDRNGTYLATSEQVFYVILDPAQMGIKDGDERYLQTTVDALSEYFGYDAADLKQVITRNPESSYIRYDKQIPYEQKIEFENKKSEINTANYKAGKDERVKGVWFEPEYKRVYPYNNLACNLIGFASSDGTTGSGGMEQYYNDSLIGTNGREYGYLNDDSNMETVVKDAENGNTIMSTIDVNIQKMVEKRIEQWKTEVGSKQIGVVVMDPSNGEILSMATDKTYDLNNPRDLSSMYTQEEQDAMSDEEKANAWNQMWRNFCVSDTFEPGSPSKVLTVSAALEENLVTPNTHFFCDGYQTIAGYNVKCTAFRKGGHGDLALDETLMVSCNDAMMQMAAMEKKETFKKYQDLFNLGSKTGIDLPGEADASTLVYQVDNMGPMDLATNSFGQNYNCTMVQMAAAFASTINGGYYYEPHIVKQILNESGSVVKKNDRLLVRETVSASTSDFIRRALVRTVAEGTGKAAQVAGYEVGGKTGTAEKIPRKQGNYLVSFCGFAPADDPQALVYVVIDEPHVEDQAHSSYASSVFSQIMGDILPYLNVFPTTDLPEEDQSIKSQLPQEEGITENTEGQEQDGETVQESETVKKPYDTEEVVPQDESEGGDSLDIPAELPGSPENSYGDGSTQAGTTAENTRETIEAMPETSGDLAAQTASGAEETTAAAP